MSKLSPTNHKRASRAKAAIFHYAKPTSRGDLECAVIDLLSDLAHFCDRERMSLAQFITTARGHYNTETEGAGVAFSDAAHDGGRTRTGNTPDECAFCGKSAESCICDEQPLEEGE